MIRYILPAVFFYSFGFGQDSFETSDLSFASEQIIFQSESDYSKTDTFSYDLNLAFDEEDKPKFYYIQMVTPVCETGHCYLVSVSIFWDLVGAYLGFSLPPDRILTKIDHEHFELADYEKLHGILSDLNWPLAEFGINELIVDSTKVLVDSEINAYSGATAPFVREQDNIRGALYTIYTLWEFVHSEHIVKKLQAYSFNLVENNGLRMIDFLSSDKVGDKVWALNNIDESIELNSQLRSSLLDIISGDDYFMAYSAIRAIKSGHLDSDSLQIGLFSKYNQVNHGLKKMIIEKFMEAPYLSSEIVTLSRSLLEQLNGQQLGDFLKLYSKHNINDLETCRTISKILQNENRYISQKAYKFLMGAKTRDSIIIENLNGYK